MGNNINDIIIKKLAKYLHNKWCEEKKLNGFHSPEKCPTIEIKNNENEIKDIDIIHCNKCLINIKDFDNLDKNYQNQYIEKANKMILELEEFGLKIINK